MIKVAMVSTEKTRGGAARMASLLAKSLSKNVDDIEVVFYHCEDNIANPPFYGIKRFASYHVNALLTRLSLGVYDFGLAKELMELTRDADILHLHNLHGYYLDWKTLLLGCKNRPVVWTWHDQWGATGRCGFAIDCNEWTKGCPKCPHLDYYPYTLVDRAAKEFTNKSEVYLRMQNLNVVSPSEWLGEIALQRGFSAKRVNIIPNPVDVSGYTRCDKKEARLKLGLPENEFIALFISADCNDLRKGYSDFSAITCNMKIYPIAVGIKPRNEAQHIHHVGNIKSKEELSLYYVAADVMVFTSKADNYPNTIIECLLCGTPIIAYSVGGVKSQLAVEHCHLVDPGHIGEARDFLSYMLINKGKNPEIENTLSRYANDLWADSVIAERYRELYIRLIK